MINWIIKLLGGYSKAQMHGKQVLLDEVANMNAELLTKSFRKSDAVYICGDNRFYEGVPYFLLEAYNTNTCWIVGKKPNDDPNASSLSWGVHVSKISHEPPKICTCCRQLIKSVTEVKEGEL